MNILIVILSVLVALEFFFIMYLENMAHRSDYATRKRGIRLLRTILIIISITIANLYDLYMLTLS